MTVNPPGNNPRQIDDALVQELFRMELFWHERYGWDNSPQIVLLLNGGVTMPIGIDDDLWKHCGGRVPTMLDFLATNWPQVRQQFSGFQDTTARALIVHEEMWAFARTGITPELLAEYTRYAAEHRIKDHPDRRNARCIYGLEASADALVQRVEGSEPTLRHHLAGNPMYPTAEAARHFFDIVTGVN